MTEFFKLESRKIEIKWEKTGSKNHPTLIFLHEGLGCIDMWKAFPMKLSQETGCPFLVYSRFGYGNSDPCPLPWKINFMHKEALVILPSLLAHTQIKNYILIGHSDGGSIGIIFAGSPFAHGLKGLITEAAHVFCEPVTVACIRQAKINFDQFDLRNRLEKYHGKNTDTAFRGWNDAWLNPNFMKWNIEKYLKRINVPMLAIQGQKDPYGTLKQIHAIKRQTRTSTIEIIDNCYHTPHLEHPDNVLKMMAGFIHKIVRKTRKIDTGK